MSARKRLAVIGVALLSGVVLTGCFSPLSLLNPDFLSAVGLGTKVASLPGEAPGLLVEVENRTSRWVSAVVSYRDGTGAVNSFTTTLAPGDKTGQLLPCPINEITLGDVSSSKTSGAIVFLTETTSTQTQNQTQTTTPSVDNSPFITVDPFGALLRTGVNYDCGDSLLFAVEPSAATQSGYQIFAFIRRAGS
jgi:hypothetical protein